ncbi:hypothetical protein EIP91_000339 [Steccherinum ochraceum]|uniref:SET domain-containing protein n=1 Tax=Steccherinum ochraceum TaxID=92696 RepID=A0A4R0RJG4_9APHY|nr:hypothetical protein EIP91_000339 [Steccherinum ochraceum]
MSTYSASDPPTLADLTKVLANLTPEELGQFMKTVKMDGNEKLPEGVAPSEIRETTVDPTRLDYADQQMIATSMPPLYEPDGKLSTKMPKDGVSECYISGYMKRKIASTPGIGARIPQCKEKVYEVAASYGKGLGMFATRDLKMGDFILAERPLLIVPSKQVTARQGAIPTGLTMQQIKKTLMQDTEVVYKCLVDRMEPPQHAAFMALANCHLTDGSGPLAGRVRTNGFQAEGLVDHEPGSDYSVVCNDLSRMNHSHFVFSCSPNTTRYWQTESFSMHLYAIRNIRKGEEITTHYTHILSPASDRQKDLEPYGFTCNCPSCRNPTASDPVRIRCGATLTAAEEAGDWHADYTLLAAPDVRVKPLLATLADHVREGVECSDGYGHTLWLLAKAYAAKQERVLGRACLEKFFAWWEAARGEVLDRRRVTRMVYLAEVGDMMQELRELVQRPDAMDIRGELSRCFKNWDYNVSLFFSETFKEAPNPGLYVEGLGPVGLPLVVRDAEAITDIARAGDGSLIGRDLDAVDMPKKGPLEIKDAKVKTENPDWQDFLSRVTKAACTKLKANATEQPPLCKLDKLVLYETGSQLSPHIEAARTDGTFARLVIILPSRYTGGAVRIGNSFAQKSSNASAFRVSVVAWYTNLPVAVEPISSGFQLALVYNLVHPAGSSPPSLANVIAPIIRLQKILRAWAKNSDAATPRQIVWGLEMKYSEEELRKGSKALKGVDASKLAVLAREATSRGFHFGLATAVMTVEGHATVTEDEWDSWNDYSYRDEGKYAEFVGTAKERKAWVENFVDLNGNPVSENFTFDKAKDTLPLDFTRVMEWSDPVEREFERDGGEYDGWLCERYTLPVLIMWPHHSNFTIRFEESKNLDQICKAIARISNNVPTAEDTKLVELALNSDQAQSHPMQVATAVCRVALLWNDLSLWQRAVRECSPAKNEGLAILESRDYWSPARTVTAVPKLVIDAVSLFGFDNVQESLDLMMKDDVRNTARFQFLDVFEAWAAAQTDDVSSRVLPWVGTSRKFVMDNLYTPSSPDEELFVSMAVEHGGLTYLTNDVLPRIPKDASGDFLRDLAVKAFDEPQFSEHMAAKTSQLSVVMEQAIERANVNTYAGLNAYYFNLAPGQPKPAVPNLRTAREYLQACLKRFDHLIPRIFQRVLDVQDMQESNVHQQVLKVVVPLLDDVIEGFMMRPKMLTELDLHVFMEAAVESALKAAVAKGAKVENGDLQALAKVVALPGGLQTFATLVMPQLRQRSLPAAALHVLVDELQCHSSLRVFHSADMSLLDQSICEIIEISNRPSSQKSYPQPPLSQWTFTH